MELDLADIKPSVAGPKRPQDRIELPHLKKKFLELFQSPISENGYGKSEADLKNRFDVSVGRRALLALDAVAGGGTQESESAPVLKTNSVSEKNTSQVTELEMMNNRPTPDRVVDFTPEDFPERWDDLGHGDVVIAAITSCTNTSNPSVMLAAGLVAKKAVERGLTVDPSVKTSLAPGSRVVTEYLARTGLQQYLDKLGFNLVGYGCTTCIGNRPTRSLNRGCDNGKRFDCGERTVG